MHFAEYIYNIAPLKTLLKSGRDINVTNYKGESILVESVKYNRVEHVKLLMEHGANTNVVDDNLDTPLLAACRTGHSDCLELLFKNATNEPDVNSVGSTDESGAMLATKRGHVDCLNLLLANGEVDLSLTNEKGENALMLAAEWNHVDCARTLLEHHVDPNAKNVKFGGRTALHVACLHGHADIVKLLIEFNANVNAFQAGRLTPLMCAVLKNHDKCVQYLLEANTDGNLSDSEGVTPAIMACSKGSNESLQLLLDAGVDINACDLYGGNCLRHAVRGRSWRCLYLLLAYGAFVKSIFNVYIICHDDPEACDKLTALLYAAGGHNYTGERDSIAEEKRKVDREERENSKEILPLYFQCKEYVMDLLVQNHPGTNRFPLVQSLHIPVGLKRTLLNNFTLDIEVPLEKALKCTSYDFVPHICAMCLRSEAELRVENLELELCGKCRIVAYCSERCGRNHWVMAHVATCEKDRRSWSYGPTCAWCARPCTKHQDDEFVSCGTCERVIYCSPICRTADWVSVHKRYCFRRRPTTMYVNLR